MAIPAAVLEGALEEELVGLLGRNPQATDSILTTVATRAYNMALAVGGGLAAYYGKEEIDRYEEDQRKRKFQKRKREGDDDPDMTQPVKFDPPIDPSVNDPNDDFYEHGSVLNEGNHF